MMYLMPWKPITKIPEADTSKKMLQRLYVRTEGLIGSQKMISEKYR
jgi:hypothetical protein